MTHRERIIKTLRDMPRGRRNEPPSLPRTVLEGLAQLKMERRAASALINLMVVSGELVPLGGPRNRTYKLGKVTG